MNWGILLEVIAMDGPAFKRIKWRVSNGDTLENAVEDERQRMMYSTSNREERC